VKAKTHSCLTGSQTNADAVVNSRKKWLDLTSAQVQINLIGLALNADAAAHPTNSAPELNNVLRLLTLQTGTQILVLANVLNQKMLFLAHQTVRLKVLSLPTGSQTSAVADVNEKKR
jgi:hypothetical protein